MHHARSKRISGANRVGHSHAKPKMLADLIPLQQQAAPAPPRDTNHLQSKFAQQLPSRRLFIFVNDIHQRHEPGQFIVIQLDDIGEPHRFHKNFRRVVSLPQIHVEYLHRMLRYGRHKLANGCAAVNRTLGQRSEANRIHIQRQLLPIRTPFQEIPCYGTRDLVLRYPVRIHFHIHHAGRMLPVRLHVIDVKPQFLHPPQRLDAPRVLAHPARHNPLIPHQSRDVSKIRWRPAQASPPRHHIPQHLPQPPDSLLHRCSPAKIRKRLRTPHKKRDSRRNPSSALHQTI